MAKGDKQFMVSEVRAQGVWSQWWGHTNGTRGGKKRDGWKGWKLRVGGVYCFDMPDYDKVQFVGVHDFLVLTLARTEERLDMLQLSADVPAIQGHGRITWGGKANMKCGEDYFRYMIPWECLRVDNKQWGAKQELDLTIRGVLGLSGLPYWFVEVPSLTRKVILGKE